MKIKQILELSQTDSLADIAKNHLSVGKEKAREALKKAGCYSQNGVKGWFFDGDKAVLEQSIYDFVEIKQLRKVTKPSPNVSTKVIKEPKKESNQRSLVGENIAIENELKQGVQQVAPTAEMSSPTPTTLIRKRFSFDLDPEVVRKLKVEAVLRDESLYKMVEDSIKMYLKELEER